MLDEHEGRPLALDHPLDGGAHLGDAHRIEVGRGLVEQQQPRAHREHAGQGETLLSARPRAPWSGGRGNGEPDGCHGLGDPRPDLGRGHTQVLAAEGDVVTDLRQDDARLGVLQNEADAAALGLGRLSVDDDATGRLTLVAAAEEPREAGEESRLAGARGTEQQHPLPRSMRRSTPRVAGSRRPA